MRDIGIVLDGMERFYGLFPRVQHLGFSNHDVSGKVSALRSTRNFALIFDDGLDQACYLVDGERIECQTPALVCIEPYSHSYCQANAGPCKKLYVTYSATEPFFTGRYPSSSFPVVSHIVLTDHLRQLVYEILSVSGGWHFPGIADKLDALCAELILEMLQARPGMGLGVVDGGSISDHLQELEEYIRSHCVEDIDFGDLSRHSGMSQRTFIRRWQERFGMPPKRYQMHCRMDLGKRYLTEEPELPIYEIAKLTGFCDQFAFSKMFHKLVGAWPSVFRQEG